MTTTRQEDSMKRKPYETETHIMRAGRLVPKSKPITLPLNDPIRKLRRV